MFVWAAILTLSQSSRRLVLPDLIYSKRLVRCWCLNCRLWFFLLGFYLLRFLLLLSKCHNGYCVLCLEVAKQFFRVQLVGEVCEFYSTQLF